MALFSDNFKQNDLTSAPFLEREVRSIQAAKAGQDTTQLPGMGGFQEALALGQTRAQEAQQLEQFDLAEQQRKQAEKEARQREKFDRKKLSQQALNLKSQFSQKSSQLLQKFQQDQDQLKFQKKAANAEQLGFYLRLNSEKYIEKLQAEGARNRLQDNVNFKTMAMLDSFQDELDMFKDNLTFAKEMNEKGRASTAEMAIYDLDTALQLALGKSREELERMKFEGISGIVSATAEAAPAAYDYFTSPSAPQEINTTFPGAGPTGNYPTSPQTLDWNIGGRR
jgi:hypothetical protein